MKIALHIAATIAVIAAMSFAGSTSAQATGSPKWLQISAGGQHTCGIRTDHSMYCWGSNSHGQLGTETGEGDVLTPTQVGHSTKWVSVSAGDDFTCALHTSGSIYCWGDNENGLLGTGTPGEDVLSPKKVGTSTSWTSVSAGKTHTCARYKTGALYCWGDNDSGEIGNDSTTDVLKPTKVGSSTSWVSVSAGFDFTCALHTGGSIYCWGYNEDGELGTGNTNPRHTPTRVGTSTHWTSVSAGDSQTCSTYSTGAIYCWGYNGQGQLGDGTIISHLSPKKAGSSTSWKSVTVGGSHACALHSGGGVYCWGDNSYLQLGSSIPGELSDHAIKTTTSAVMKSVEAGSKHTCAVSTSGYAYCWGNNDFGQLGDGTGVAQEVPTKILHTSAVTS